MLNYEIEMKTLSNLKTKLIITVIVILTLPIGMFVYTHMSSKTTNPPSKSRSLSSGQTETIESSPIQSNKVSQNNNLLGTANNQSVLEIPELGIELTNIPVSIKDLNYIVNVRHSDPSGWTSAWFSTTTLTSKDTNCSASVGSLGILEKVIGTYRNEHHVAFVKQYDGFWIAHESPQAPCSEDKDTQDLTMSQLKLFNDLVSNQDNIQLLNN